ncbi:MAG: anti-sigma F factor [Clostridia bacterium]|nr:anti-sigma F factor [Clostridia bacterium]
MDWDSCVKIELEAKEENAALARVIAAAFAARMNPTLNETEDVKVAVSEAVTNAAVHAYGREGGIIVLEAYLKGNTLTVVVRDFGRGIEDIEKAKEPLFTTSPNEERSGLGFTVMESFMDSLHIKSCPGKGTTVVMTKEMGKKDE